MTPPAATALILDADNTLYDWFACWHSSFTALVRFLEQSTGVEREPLLDEIRCVHQRVGTSDYGRVSDELACLRAGRAPEALELLCDAAASVYDDGSEPVLYSEVLTTLRHVHETGVPIVVHTDAKVSIARARVRQLGICDMVTALYASTDGDFPPVPSSPLRTTHVVELQPEQRKPSLDGLRAILADLGAEPRATVYVGDSLVRDIAPAQELGLHDVHAAYGCPVEKDAYELLRRVSHWTDADVEVEKRLNAVPAASPSNTIRDFGELLELFRWTPGGE